MNEGTLLQDLLIIVVAAVTVVAILRRIGVPSIAGFILAGVLVGPDTLGLVSEVEQVERLAEVGVVLLLFGIGLELSAEKVRRLLRPMLLGGGLQVSLTILLAGGLALLMGMDWPQALFLGMVVAVSSTAIVLRGLGERGELQSPHGRLTLGILVFQDLSVVPMILVLPLLAGTGEEAAEVLPRLGRTLVILAVILTAARFGVPKALHWIAITRQRDLFVMTVVLACLGTAWLLSLAGISLALGAFLAGMIVGTSGYRHQALADMIPFREVLTSIFFVSIGMLLSPDAALANPGAVLGLAATLIVGKFLIVVLVGLVLRLPIGVSVLAGASLAQVGEFAFVLLHAAEGTGLITPDREEPFLVAVILSMLVTPLIIAAGPHIAFRADRFGLLTRLMNVRIPEAIPDAHALLRDHVIISGYGMTGSELAHSLKDLGIPYVILDLNAENVRAAELNLEPAFFGDASNPEILRQVAADQARALILAINDPAASLRAVQAARSVAPDLHIIARVAYVIDQREFTEAGANEVVTSEIEAAVALSERVLRHYEASDPVIETQLNRIRSHPPD